MTIASITPIVTKVENIPSFLLISTVTIIVTDDMTIAPGVK